jgi:hypothetical protein
MEGHGELIEEADLAENHGEGRLPAGHEADVASLRDELLASVG